MLSGLSRNGPLELELESRNLQDREPGSCELFDATSARGSVIGSFSKDDGYSNENVIPKYNLAMSQVFRD